MTEAAPATLGTAVERFADWLRRRIPQGPLRTVLRAIRRRLPRPLPPTAIGRIVAQLADSYPEAFFIQVGSNDATQLDPLRSTVVSTAWRGILIEPVPYVFARLKRQYGEIDRVVLENVAISDRDGSRDFYYLRQAEDGARLPAWYDALGSFKRDVILSHARDIPDIESRLACEPLPCLTFESLCRKHGVTTVDLIHIDVEGYDYEIIKLIDLERYQPKVVIYEHRHLSPADRAACEAHLQRAGFELLSEGPDTVGLNTSGRVSVSRGLKRLWRRLESSRA